MHHLKKCIILCVWSGWCGWSPDFTTDHAWFRGHNLSISSDLGTVPDHTYGSDNGYYLYIDQQSSEQPGPATMTSFIHFNAYFQCIMEVW